MHSVEVIKITLAVPPAAHHLQRIERADKEGGHLSWGGGRSSGCLFLPAEKRVNSPVSLYGLCCACSCCPRAGLLLLLDSLATTSAFLCQPHLVSPAATHRRTLIRNSAGSQDLTGCWAASVCTWEAGQKAATALRPLLWVARIRFWSVWGSSH